MVGNGLVRIPLAKDRRRSMGTQRDHSNRISYFDEKVVGTEDSTAAQFRLVRSWKNH